MELNAVNRQGLVLHPHDNALKFCRDCQAVRHVRRHKAVVASGLKRILDAVKYALSLMDQT